MSAVTRKGHLHLLVVGIRWPPETFIQRKLVGLASRGIQVTAAAAVPAHQPRYTLPGVRLVRVPHWADPLPSTVMRIVTDGLKLSRKVPHRWRSVISATAKGFQESPSVAFARLRSYLPVAALRPDVVYFEWNSAAIDYMPLFDVWRCPTVISCRGSQINVRPHVPGNEPYIRGLFETFQRAAAVHCVSESIKREAMRYGLDPKKAHVIYPAVDPTFFQPPSHSRTECGPIRLITVGSLGWVKGLEYALIAMRSLLDAGVQAVFDIIGDGPERQRILYTIDDLGLTGAVRLHGRLGPDAVRARLQQADVFLLSSLSEGISNAALEAMACGLPVVTTDCGGMREAIADGVEGFVVPVRDPRAMATALTILAADQALRQRMGQAARDRVLQQFTLDRQIDKFMSLLQALYCQNAR